MPAPTWPCPACRRPSAQGSVSPAGGCPGQGPWAEEGARLASPSLAPIKTRSQMTTAICRGLIVFPPKLIGEINRFSPRWTSFDSSRTGKAVPASSPWSPPLRPAGQPQGLPFGVFRRGETESWGVLSGRRGEHRQRRRSGKQLVGGTAARRACSGLQVSLPDRLSPATSGAGSGKPPWTCQSSDDRHCDIHSLIH